MRPRRSHSPFFDLLAVHELAHIFIEADGRTPSRFWILELACILFLHAYVQSEEPERLLTLTAFPSLFADIEASRFTHRTLDDFELSYAHGMDGANYGWFQSKLHVAAKHLYDTGGNAAVHGMWRLLAEERSGDLAPSWTSTSARPQSYCYRSSANRRATAGSPPR